MGRSKVAQLGTRGPSVRDLLARSTARRVTFARLSPSFEALLSETRGLCAVYIFEAGRHVLRVGKSQGYLAARLKHHLDNGYRAYKGDFAHYHVFFKALVGQRLTIRWLECDPSELKRVEGRLLVALDPVWQRLMRRRQAGARVNFASVRQLLHRR